ncbi:uncharacterized protein Dana_GF14520, isoform A [Drosophila ananassae]|uniref:Uncharacterized protein, isoform A n=2 Tax=Drosophila ananassae TaxID=7217 RepID=B3MKF0_DROAN|nr:uncharacterized protein LOC6497343 isoform X1 [Drosophila ananassae]EDV31503.1 uncharacterized protein Dana_GF14520, isoform A [Drosophila ananassae]
MGSCLGNCATSAATASFASSQPRSTSDSSAASSSTTSSTSCVGTSWFWQHRRNQDRFGEDGQGVEAELISNISGRRRERRGFIFRILRFKRSRQCPQFFDEYWQQPSNYAKLQNESSAMPDIQLQNLDAFKLLNAQIAPRRETEIGQGVYNRTNSSRASSSLDLEWEHEYSQLRQYQHHQAQTESQPTTSKPCYASMDQLTTTTTVATNGRHAGRQLRMGQRLGSASCCSSTQNSWSHISTPESLEWDVDEERKQQGQLRMEDDNLDEETLKLLDQIEQLKHHVLLETGDALGVEANGC